MANSSDTTGMNDILTAVQNWAISINSMFKAMNTVSTTTSSGAVTIHLTQVSS